MAAIWYATPPRTAQTALSSPAFWPLRKTREAVVLQILNTPCGLIVRSGTAENNISELKYEGPEDKSNEDYESYENDCSEEHESAEMNLTENLRVPKMELTEKVVMWKMRQKLVTIWATDGGPDTHHNPAGRTKAIQ